MADTDRGGAAPVTTSADGGLFRQVFVDAGIVREAARRLVETNSAIGAEEMARLLTDLTEGIGRLADRLVATEGFAALGAAGGPAADLDLRDDGQVSPARRRLLRRLLPSQ